MFVIFTYFLFYILYIFLFYILYIFLPYASYLKLWNIKSKLYCLHFQLFQHSIEEKDFSLLLYTRGQEILKRAMLILNLRSILMKHVKFKF